MGKADRWLSGRKRPPAKWVWRLTSISGSNPDLSASFVFGTMKRLGALALALGLLLCVAQAQTFDEYLKARKRYGISQAASVVALETIVGTRVLEVRGLVKGVVGDSESATLIVNNPEGGELYIRTSNVPDWLRGFDVPARLLVKASREGDLAPIDAEMIGAAPEPSVASYEAKLEAAEAKRLAAKLRKKGNKKQNTPMPGKIPTMARNWSTGVREALPYYAAFILSRNPKLGQQKAVEIAAQLLGFSVYYGVDARLIVAMVLVESGFKPNATSRAGAQGLGQLMPSTAKGMGVSNSYDTEQNLYGTVRLVRGHLERYNAKTGDNYRSLVLALAAYNAGSGAVRKYGGVPPYAQTQNYVRMVTATYRRLSGQ